MHQNIVKNRAKAHDEIRDPGLPWFSPEGCFPKYVDVLHYNLSQIFAPTPTSVVPIRFTKATYQLHWVFFCEPPLNICILRPGIATLTGLVDRWWRGSRVKLKWWCNPRCRTGATAAGWSQGGLTLHPPLPLCTKLGEVYMCLSPRDHNGMVWEPSLLTGKL